MDMGYVLVCRFKINANDLIHKQAPSLNKQCTIYLILENILTQLKYSILSSTVHSWHRYYNVASFKIYAHNCALNELCLLLRRVGSFPPQKL